MDIVKKFSDITGYSVSDIISGSENPDLIIVRGIYAKLRVEGHGETVKSVTKELNLPRNRANYARKKVDNYLEIGYEDVTSLWESVQPLIFDFLHSERKRAENLEMYKDAVDHKMRNFLDKVCHSFDDEYYDYSHRKKRYMRVEARRWFDAVMLNR